MNHWNGSGRISRIIGMSKNGKSFMYQIATKDTEYVKGNSEFVTCLTFGKNANWALKWLKKGILVNVEGRLHFTSIKKDDGTYKNFACVIVNSHELLGGKKDESFSNVNEKELPVPEDLVKDFE